MKRALIVLLAIGLIGISIAIPSATTAAPQQCQRTCFQSPQCCDLPIRPFIQCMAIDPNGKLQVTFGYENPNMLPTIVGVSFSPSICRANNVLLGADTQGGFPPQNKTGQPVRFEPGLVLNAFAYETPWNADDPRPMLTWFIDDIRVEVIRSGANLFERTSLIMRIADLNCVFEATQPDSSLPVCAGGNALSQLLGAQGNALTAVETRVTQLEQRVSVLETRVDSLSQPLGDDDGDGVINQNDACPDTPPETAVDVRGCSRTQFCNALPLSGKGKSKNSCTRGNWDQDGLPDCMVVGSECVARP